MTICYRSAIIGICLATLGISSAVVGRTLTAHQAAQAGKTADQWAPYRFLLGDWEGIQGSGQPGETTSGGFTMSLDLGDKVLVRKSRADYAPKPGEKTGISHQDMTIVYQVAGETQLRAFYVDNEGHAINYLVTSPKEGVAVFETDAAEHGARFRLDYQQNPDRSLTITFSIAPPGGSYKTYTRGTARRKTGGNSRFL